MLTEEGGARATVLMTGPPTVPEYYSRTKTRSTTPVLERFFRKIERIPESGCWIWMGGTDGHGYGLMSTRFKCSPVKAHRVAYTLFIGPIPEGLVVRHKCDVPSCVNPYHLVAGTQRENVADMVGRGRQNPKSLLNLHPGELGKYGAGSKSNKEITENVSK